MAIRTKTTPLARFLIMLLIVAPIAYLGSAYYNGEDGIQNIKNIFSSDNTHIENTISDEMESLSKPELIEKIELLEMKVSQLEQKVDNLESQNQ